MSDEKKWYGARCLFRIEVEATDSPSMVEDRVILVEAGDSDEAMVLAETEAREYATFRWVNADGEHVGIRYLEVCDLYEMNAGPRQGIEVHSTRVFVEPGVSDDEIEDRLLGAQREVEAVFGSRFVPDLDRTAELIREREG